MTVFGDFPPVCIEDIMSYDEDDVVAGYREWGPDDPAPGPNRSPGYRWGWTNRQRDATGQDDPYVALRHDYIKTMRFAA